METCVRGFSTSFIPESSVEPIDLQYIEGGELERAWKSTRRQRLKQQENKIWENFVKEQDILKSVCVDDPYQFLDVLPDTYLKELMNSELHKIKLELAEEEAKRQAEAGTAEEVQHTVTFAEVNENEDNDVFHVYDDDKNEDVSGVEDEVLNDSSETPCTVREQDDEPAGMQAGERDGEPVLEPEAESYRSPVRSVEKSSCKSSENVSNLIESSIYCAKVKDLRMKINEEIYAIMKSLENQHVASLEPQKLRNMCKRSGEFCGRFQRIHMYQLQRQIRDIKRHNALALPFAKHTQFQSQMVRIVSLHQNMLQSFQVFHKSFSQTFCLRESAASLQALGAALRDACVSSRGCCVPHVPAARDLFTEELFATCDRLDEAVNHYVAKVTDFVNATEASVTCSIRSRKSPQKKDKKRTGTALSKNTSKSEAGARLSMYSLAALRAGPGKQPAAGQSGGGTAKGRISNRGKTIHDNQDTPKSYKKSPRSRRPLMRDPQAGQAPRARRPTDLDIRTMVEVVEPPSSHISREASPRPTPRTPHAHVHAHVQLHAHAHAHAARPAALPPSHSPRTPRIKDMKSKLASPRGNPATQRLKPRIKTAISDTQETVLGDQMSPVSKIQCARKMKEEAVETVELVEERVVLKVEPPVVQKPVFSDRSDRDRPKNQDLTGCEVTRLLRQLCGGDAAGNRGDRSSGAKNAQLLCINGGSPRQPSTPQLLKILEETIQKKVHKPRSPKSSKAKDVDRLRLNFNIPDKTAENLYQYRTKFVQHMLTSSMYANSAVGKPWEMISSVSEQIIDDLLLATAKEMEIHHILKDLYYIETN